MSRLPAGNVGCYHWQYSYQNLFNFLQIVCMSTCQNTHPGKVDKPYAILCTQHMSFCLLKLWGCSPVAEQKLLWHQREHDRKSWRSRRKKQSSPTKGRANSLFVQYPQPEIWKERRFLGDIPNLTAGGPGQAAAGNPAGYEGLQRPLPTTSTAIVSEEQFELCFQGGWFPPSISKAEESEQQFQDCIPAHLCLLPDSLLTLQPFQAASFK